MRGLRGHRPAQAVIEYLCAMVIGLMAVVSVLSVLPQWIELVFLQVLDPVDQVMGSGALGRATAGVTGSIPDDSSDE